MAPIDLKLGQNAFQAIPELSLFDVEDRKIFGFFGLDHVVLARTHASWPEHLCPGQDNVLAKTHVFWPKHMSLDQDSRVPAPPKNFLLGQGGPLHV